MNGNGLTYLYGKFNLDDSAAIDKKELRALDANIPVIGKAEPKSKIEL